MDPRTRANDATSSGADRAEGWVEVLARMGYAAKGIVYLAVGVLSAGAAFGIVGGTGSGAQGSREALSSLSYLAEDSLGMVLMILIATGLAGYVMWTLVQALLDPEDEGTDGKGLMKRGARLVAAVLYSSLGFWVVRSLVLGMGDGGSSGGSGRNGASTWSQELLSQPWGRWLLGLSALAVVGYGIAEFVKAARRTYERRLRRDLNGSQRTWAGRIARFGLSARGVVFLIIGGFLAYAAITADPDEARGLEGAMRAISEQPFGPWLMGLVATGLAAYGAFQLMKAWYRRIGPVDPV